MCDWIKKIKANENAALKEIYQKHRDACVQWLKHEYVFSNDDAVEIFQLAVIILYDNVRAGKLTNLSSSIKTYLFGIARNKAMELIRSHKHQTNIDVVQVVSTYVASEYEEEDGIENIALASKALEKLGDPCKSLLTQFYYHNKSMDEITTTMNYKNADTTKNQKYKCLKRLQHIYFSHSQKSL